MSYSEYSGSQGPRPIRVILGGTLAIACCLIGSVVMTHEYHRALTMKEQAEELDWETFAERGPVDNAFVCLTEVELDQTDPLAGFEDLEEMFGDLDPDADPEAAFEALVQTMDEVNPMEMVRSIVAPVKVIPQGADGDSVREAIVIPRVDHFIAEAERQLQETGTLSGYVSTYQGDEFARAIMTYTGNEELLEELEDRADIAKVYTIEPMALPLDQSTAGSNYWLCGIGLALGLILCGSGGPALSTCVFFTGPSLLSLLGFPMRYGRGGTATRIVYLLIGIGLVSYGYQLMIVQGQFGQIGGDPILHSLGFIGTFVGFAAMLAVPAQIISRKIEASLDVAPSRKHEVKMTVSEACSLMPLETVETVYQDRDLVPSLIDNCPDDLRQLSESLTTVGFNPAEPRHWQADEQTSHAAIQMGCQEMVVSDIEIVDGRAECRMVSMLHDGLTLMTLSSNVKVDADRRVGSNGMYQRSKADKPDQMLAQHLEETISIAEKRDTSVVTFESSELSDVCHLARRVLADIQNQYGESILDVDTAQYGRFRFPMQPIAEAMAV